MFTNKKVMQKKEEPHPDPRVASIEKESGISFADVKIHYASDKPKEFGALAYAYGNDVYLGSGQEKHLKHELGHVVQQRQGIVSPTHYEGGFPVNESNYFESSANTFIPTLKNAKSLYRIIQKMPTIIHRLPAPTIDALFSMRHLCPADFDDERRIGDFYRYRGDAGRNTIIFKSEADFITAITGAIIIETIPDGRNNYKFNITVTIPNTTFSEAPEKVSGRYTNRYFNIKAKHLRASSLNLGGHCSTRSGANAIIDHLGHY